MRLPVPDGLRKEASSTILSWTWWRGVPPRGWARLVALRKSPWFQSLVRLSVPVLLLFLVLGSCQAVVKLNDRRNETFVSFKQPLVDPGYGELQLIVTLPQSSRFGLDGPKRVPLSISLLRGTPSPATPSAQRAVAPKYIVAVSTQSGEVEFTDKDGVPVVPQFVMQPTYDAADPAVVYVHPSDTGRSMKLAVSVLVAADQPLPGAAGLVVSIPVERAWQSLLRYMWDKFLEAGVLVILVTAVVHYGIDQWKRIEEENRVERQQKAAHSEAIRTQIEEFKRLLERNPSEGARRYLHYATVKEGDDLDPDFQKQLDGAWLQIPSENLRRVCELQKLHDQGKLPQAGSKGDGEHQRDVTALLWCYDHLDEDWKQKISHILNLLKESLPKEEIARQWKAVLRPWPSVHAWTPSRFVDQPAVMDGVRRLHEDGRLSREINPFSTAPGELDALLLEARVNPPGFDQILKAEPTLILGDQGAGKTALALLVAYQCVLKGVAFPIYYPRALSVDADRESHLGGVAEAITLTLLAHWIAQPTPFIKQSLEVKARLARLVARYVGTGKHLVLRMRELGCSPVDSSEIVLRTLQELADGLSGEGLIDERELIAALSVARPIRTAPDQSPESSASVLPAFVLVDISSGSTAPNLRRAAYRLDPLLALAPALAQVGIYLKLFLPAALASHLAGIEAMSSPITLEWDEKGLKNLMERRFLQSGRDDVFTNLCETYEVEDPSTHLIRHVVNKAERTPACLFELGSKLIGRIATHPDNPVITDDDLLTLLPSDSGEHPL